MRQLKQNELQKFRNHFHLKQNKVCPILKKKFEDVEMVVDHKHSTKSKGLGVDGNGIVRGIIHRQANVIEGKISNAYIRYGLHKCIPLPELLRNLADYLENPPLGSRKFLHPTEKPKPKKLKRISYNKLKKMYDGKIKFPTYPKTGILTVKLKELFETYELEPEFYR